MAIRSVEALIRLHEGERLIVYDDATGQPIRQGDTLVGHPTIGIGRNLAGRGLSALEAEILLANDVAAVTVDVLRAHPWIGTIGPVRSAALIDMAFNLGVAGLGQFTKTLHHCRNAAWSDAAFEMLDSRWADQVGPRAERLAGMVRLGSWPDE